MKGGNIRFVDLHYKGIRIRQEWRHLMRDTFLMVFLILFIPLFLFFLSHCGGLGLLRNNHWYIDLGVGVLFPSLFLAGIFSGASFLIVPLWNELKDLQGLCEMIYTYPLYQVQNYITPGVSVNPEDAGKVKREITYFPRIYYLQKHGMVEVTVRLDGSQFHVSGDFENLTKALEEAFVLNVVDMTRRREFLTYHLFRDPEKNRIRITDVKPDGYAIPLMKGIFWRISEAPHALVVGGTGGGKSFFLNALIRAFLLMDAELYICDPKNSALADYGRILPRVQTGTDGILWNLKRCLELMEERYPAVKKNPDYQSGQDFTGYGLSPVVLVLDEYAAFASSLDRKLKEEFKSDLHQLAMMGREAGVFVILATQRPDAEYLPGPVRDQLGLRVTLGKMSADGYRMAFGTTTQTLGEGKQGQGYFYMNGMTFIQRFCSPYVPKDYDFIAEAEKLIKRKEGNSHERKGQPGGSGDSQEDG